MWKIILNNVNSLILANWKALFMFVLGAVAGVFLFSCSMMNSAVDTVQETSNDVADYIMGEDSEDSEDTVE